MSTKKTILNYSNNYASIKWHNRRVIVKRGKDGLMHIIFVRVSENTDPSCSFAIVRGKVRVSNILLDDEAMRALVACYLKLSEKTEFKLEEKPCP